LMTRKLTSVWTKDVLGRTEPAGSVLSENTVRLRRSGKLVAGVDEIHIEWRTRHAILKWRAMLPGITWRVQCLSVHHANVLLPIGAPGDGGGITL
jgi:hypothetical protein